MTKYIRSHWWITFRLVGFVVLLAAVFAGGFVLRSFYPASSGLESRAQGHGNHKDAGAKATSAPQIWTCSMHPQIRQPNPGNCPICGMKLIPVTSTGAGGLRQITLDPEAVKLMQLKTSPVERRFVTATVRMVGKVDYDETKLKRITAWVGGRLEELYVNFTGVPVKEGDHMVLIYSPELYSAQTELLQAIKFKKIGGATSEGIDLVESAREKLRLYGMSPKQIKEIEAKGTPSYQLTVNAPIGGIVIHKSRNQGDYVKIGDPIYTIADLSQLWVQFDAYESDLEWIRYGQEVTLTTEAYPGEQFKGLIAFIDPVLNEKTRTVKVRVNVDNPSGKLKPEMLVHGILHSNIAAGGRVMDPNLAGKWISPMHPEVIRDEPGPCPVCGMPLVRTESLGYVAPSIGPETKPLVVPKSAVLVTGTRAVVYLQIKGQPPTFEGREIVLGPRAGDYYLVRSGLKEGDLVVTNGNFKLDSALQIQAKPSMMTPEGGGGGGHDHGDHGTMEKGHKDVAGKGQMKIPAAFHQQLVKLDQAYQEVAKAFETDDMEKFKKSFDRFSSALNKVDGELLEEHPRMVWKELHMLLNNDVVIAQNMKQRSEAKRLWSELQDHMRRVREQFGHGHAGHGIDVAAIPAEFHQQLGTFWKAYLPLQKALAADNLNEAQMSLPSLRKALAGIEGKLLPEGAMSLWEKEQKQMGKVLDELEKAKDLKTFRDHFSALSGGLLATIQTFGLPNAGPVYQLHCSMAFNNRGAKWLQDTNQPHNPYFGEQMLTCANQVQIIAGSKGKQGGEHRHE